MQKINEINKCILTLADGRTADLTAFLDMPFSDNPVLDESLETASLSLSGMSPDDFLGVDISAPFEPFSRVQITFKNQSTAIDLLVQHDDCKMICKGKNAWRSYSHRVQLIDPLKLTERYTVDTLTNTNPVHREYDDAILLNWVKTSGEDSRDWHPPENLKELRRTATITLSNNAETFRRSDLYTVGDITSLSISIYEPNGNVQTRTYTPGGVIGQYPSTSYTFTLSHGEHRVEYVLDYVAERAGGVYFRTVKYEGYIYIDLTEEDDDETKPSTLAQTLTRLLSVTPTRTADEAPVFHFDPDQLAELSEVEAPETPLQGYTLFEALNFYAGYRGMFPAVRFNNGLEVYFRPFFNGVRLTADDLPRPIDDVRSSDGEQYCTHLDSEVQNLVGVNDSNVGTITEPYARGWKTTRSGNGGEISQDTAKFPTSYPAYQISQLRTGYAQGTAELKTADISAYLYEKGDYNALSDVSQAYPLSKAYALKWGQFERDITELAHRIQPPDPTGIKKALQAPALANIMSAVTGETLDTGIVEYIKQLIGMQNGDSFADLLYQITYTPIVNARVKQYKAYLGGFGTESAIKYNQSAELVDSEAFGQHLSQLARKLGNDIRQRIYIFERLDDVPKCGTMVDGLIVFDEALTIYENRVIATLSYVPYAELNRYIGVSNAWKDSDVSREKWYQRFINYGEYMLFTDDEAEAPSGNISAEMLTHYLPSSNARTLTSVELRGIRANGDELPAFVLPVVSLAVGNALLFHFETEDNRGAGAVSSYAPENSTNLITGTKYNRAERAFLYTDIYGRLETLSFKLQRTNANTWSNTHEVAQAIGYELPAKSTRGSVGIQEEVQAGESNDYLTVDNLVVEKNSREKLIFDVQIHNYTDNANAIIGAGLTNFSPLVGAKVTSSTVFAFRDRLNPNTRYYKISEDQIREGFENGTLATYGYGLTFDPNSIRVEDKGNGKRIHFDLPPELNEKNADVEYKWNSWAYVATRDEAQEKMQIIVGENRDIMNKDFVLTKYLVPKKKIKE